jgi:hypothetical protein
MESEFGSIFEQPSRWIPNHITLAILGDKMQPSDSTVMADTGQCLFRRCIADEMFVRGGYRSRDYATDSPLQRGTTLAAQHLRTTAN